MIYRIENGREMLYTTAPLNGKKIEEMTNEEIEQYNKAVEEYYKKKN